MSPRELASFSMFPEVTIIINVVRLAPDGTQKLTAVDCRSHTSEDARALPPGWKPSAFDLSTFSSD